MLLRVLLQIFMAQNKVFHIWTLLCKGFSFSFVLCEYEPAAAGLKDKQFTFYNASSDFIAESFWDSYC